MSDHYSFKNGNDLLRVSLISFAVFGQTIIIFRYPARRSSLTVRTVARFFVFNETIKDMIDANLCKMTNRGSTRWSMQNENPSEPSRLGYFRLI